MGPDQRLQQLAARSANFGFLLPLEPLLLSYGAAAEAHVYEDPNTSLMKARQFGEATADALMIRMALRSRQDRQVDKLRALNNAGATMKGAQNSTIRRSCPAHSLQKHPGCSPTARPRRPHPA